jgi:hypothetical protein
MNPLQESHQTIPFVSGIWNGDCWKAFVQLRYERSDLQMHVVDTDHGCGVISKGSQIPLELMNTPLEYNFFNMYRKEWLNLISPAEFCKIYLDQDISTIDSMLKNFVEKPNDPETNFALARFYHELGQTASAVSYYIRTAERTEDLFLRYESLLHAANCFERQGTRRFTVKGILQQAITIMPKRPEAYYLLSKLYEHNESNEGRFLDSYTMCSIALQVCSFEDVNKPFRYTVDYPGKYAIMFQKAITGWWCGLQEETKTILLDLYTNYDMAEHFYNSVRNNLINMGAFASKHLTNYTKDKFDKVKVKFDNLDKIERNYSESYQDMFVLSITNGKTNGSYLEIGSGHPSYGNNTYLLEKQFGWNGISVDLSEEFIALHKTERNHHALLKDDKLQTEEINNPLNDSIKAKDLFFDEVSTFNQAEESLKQIFYFLLHHQPQFQGFFTFINYKCSAISLENVIRNKFQLSICDKVDLKNLIADYPIELAYCLALINCNNRYSITPPWVLKNFPKVEHIMFLLRNKPCLIGCNYCNQALGIHRGLKRYFGFDNYSNRIDNC